MEAGNASVGSASTMGSSLWPVRSRRASSLETYFTSLTPALARSARSIVAICSRSAPFFKYTEARPLLAQRSRTWLTLTTTSNAEARQTKATATENTLNACRRQSFLVPRQARSMGVMLILDARFRSGDAPADQFRFVVQAVGHVGRLAFVEHDHAPGSHVEERAVVRREQDGHAGLVDVLEQAEDVDRKLRVEVARRFVRQKQRRLADD